MITSVAFKCDRCEVPAESTMVSAVPEGWSIATVGSSSAPPRLLHLCPSCAEAMNAALTPEPPPGV